ncbi:hypothetical protein NDU88_002697, partial [Pleurodeles waltl]
SLVMEGFVGMGQELEVASFLDREPMEVLQVLGDVGSRRQVEDQSGSCVLDHL